MNTNGFDRAAWDRLATLFAGTPAEHRYDPQSPFICDYCGQQTHAIGGASLGVECPKRVPYAGYTPEVREAPNGDTKACQECCGSGQGFTWPKCPTCHGTGRVPNVDAGPAGKRYLHVAEKYLAQHPGLEWPREYLARAYYEICRVADALRVPDAYYPRPEDTTLRVLEYPAAAHDYSWGAKRCKNAGCGAPIDVDHVSEICPALAPGAGTVEHTDPNLFTIVCWRETPEDLELRAAPRVMTMSEGPRYAAGAAIAPGLHIGQIGELVGLGPATPHRVPARPYVQRSIVAFAMPRLDAVLPVPGGETFAPPRRPTVREWIEAWKKRGRVYT